MSHNQGFWYRKYYKTPSPYKPSKDDGKIANIVGNFARLYKEMPNLYNVFSQAQDRENLVLQAIDSIVKPNKTALEIGSGTGRHLLLSEYFNRYICLEPELSMINTILKTPRNVEIINGRFPEDTRNLLPIDAVFAFWTDVPVHIFVQFIDNSKIAQAFWIMSGPNSDFAGLWPKGAREAWQRRSKWLEANGFVVKKIKTRLAFDSIDNAKLVLTNLFGLLDADINEFNIGHEILVHHKMKD